MGRKLPISRPQVNIQWTLWSGRATSMQAMDRGKHTLGETEALVFLKALRKCLIHTTHSPAAGGWRFSPEGEEREDLEAVVVEVVT